jgi:uncharacterized metal-binding protein
MIKGEYIMTDNCCSNGTKLLYSCSGAADVGKLADLVTRRLRDDGYARMTCLAGIGADLSGFVLSAKSAEENITIDGCGNACAKKCLERIGVKPVSIVLSDLGYEKGSTNVNDDSVDDAAMKIKSGAAALNDSSSGLSCGCGGKC